MCEKVDASKVEEALRYAHDHGFDEGYECGYEDGYDDGYRDGMDGDHDD